MRTPMMLAGLNRKLWRWFELAGQCCAYAETGDLPDDDSRDLWDGRALDPGEVYSVNGIDELERFAAMRSPRS